MYTKLACIVGVTLAVSSTGCFRHSYTTGSGGNANAQASYSAWHSHWLFGLIGEETVDVKRICPSGNATVKDSQSFLNSLVASFVGPIYWPTTVEIYCDGGRTASVTLQPDVLRRIGERPETMSIARAVSPQTADELARAIEASRSQRPSAVAKANHDTAF